MDSLQEPEQRERMTPCQKYVYARPYEGPITPTRRADFNLSLSLSQVEYKSHCNVLPLRYKREGPILLKNTSTQVVTCSIAIQRSTLHWTMALAWTNITSGPSSSFESHRFTIESESALASMSNTNLIVPWFLEPQYYVFLYYIL
jgi:hypothetical protein